LTEQGLTSHQTHYTCRSYRGRFLQVIQCKTGSSSLIAQAHTTQRNGADSFAVVVDASVTLQMSNTNSNVANRDKRGDRLTYHYLHPYIVLQSNRRSWKKQTSAKANPVRIPDSRSAQLPKFSEDFIVQGYICGRICIKIRSVFPEIWENWGQCLILLWWKKPFKKFLDPDRDADNFQNL